MEITYQQYLNPEKSKTPYQDSFEHLTECFFILNAYLDMAKVWMEKRGDSRQIRIEFEKMHQHRDSRIRASMEMNRELRLENLIQWFHLSTFEAFVITLALYWERHPENINLPLQGFTHRFPTKGFAVELYRMVHGLEEWEEARFINESGNLFRYLLWSNQQEERKEAFLTEPILIRKRLATYVFELVEQDSRLDGYAKLHRFYDGLPEPLVHQNHLERLENIWMAANQNRACCIHLYGKRGIGKRFLLLSLAKRRQFHVLIIRLAQLLQDDAPILEKRLYDLFLEGVLSHAVFCFEIENTELLHAYRNQESLQYERILRFAKEDLPCFFLLSDEKDVVPQPFNMPYVNLGIPSLPIKDKILLWNAYAKDYDLDPDVSIESLANRYSVSIQGIRDVLHTAHLIAKSEKHGFITKKDVIHSVKQLQSNQLGNEAIRMNAEFGWDDFIIDEKAKKQMALACNQVKYKYVVYDEWGFRKKLPYGKGVSVLFYGPPGTGKTMAAQVMASDLGIDLYRIDLSQLVSKYIGETEKNLSTLFKNASNGNVLLFFDEADAIFAKRSEVMDSNDRNANAMTAHLLQKLEDFDGMAILATNYIGNIDDAFKRRIRHMIRFAFPTSEERFKLWNTILPKDVTCEETLDFKFFAEKFELSGSSIKEVLVNAAFMAAADGMGLKNLHIMEGIKMNYAKYGKTLTDEDFEYLVSV